MTSTEYLKRLIHRYCLERYGVDSVDVDLAREDDGITIVRAADLETVLLDFEIWRAVYEVTQKEKSAGCLI